MISSFDLPYRHNKPQQFVSECDVQFSSESISVATQHQNVKITIPNTFFKLMPTK